MSASLWVTDDRCVFPGVPQQNRKEVGMNWSRVAVAPAFDTHAGFDMPAGRLARTAVFVVCALFLAALAPATGTVRAATGSSHAAPAASPADAAAPLKAVIIVGPAGSLTGQDLIDAESAAAQAESYGMDVRRVFFPHATWDNVMANIQGANLVLVMGHGYGWPSPYPPFRENLQDGIGLDPYDGANANQTKYYGGNLIRENWVLAPNAIVMLNHMCYTAGNGEPGMARPSWDVAVQRVDNFAAAFLAVGARAVFAYSGQSYNRGVRQLFTTDDTIAQMFTTPGSHPKGYFGYVGWDPRQFDSVRTPGMTNFLDPDSKLGFVRAVTGDMSMTASDWAQGATSPSADPPVLSNFSVDGSQATAASGGSSLPVFTPNGDGVSDDLTMTYTVDREAFVDLSVTNGSGNVVRTISSWSPGGDGTATWDGRNDNGNYVNDGTYTFTATPRDRTGTTGDPQTAQAKVLTAMSSPAVTPDLFYPADGDNFAQTTTLSVSLDQEATFWWKIADGDGNVVATHVNGVDTNPGALTWQWDGRDKDGNYVPDGTYYSVTTAQSAAGMYYHSVPVEVDAFRVVSTKTELVRGTKVKFLIYSAEPLKGRAKLRVTFPGLAPKTYRTYASAAGYYYVKVKLPATAGAGTITVHAFGHDTGGQLQATDYTFDLQ